MQFAIILLGTAILFMGCWGMAAPRSFRAWIRSVSSPSGYYLASGLRFVLAGLFWLSADYARLPLAMEILAVVSLVAALVLMVIGYQRYRRLVSWWLHRGNVILRVSMLFAIAFGGFLVWVVS